MMPPSELASQLNCLEMANPNITPEDGLTMYIRDHTQGPVCAMATPAVWRIVNSSIR